MTALASSRQGSCRPTAATPLLPVQKRFLLSILLMIAVNNPSCQAFQSPLHVPNIAGVVSRGTSLTYGAFSRGAANVVQSDLSVVHWGRSQPGFRSNAEGVRLSMRFIPTDEVVGEGDLGSSPTITSDVALDHKSRASTDPLQGSDLVQLSIWPHAPLGCVVDECLATYDNAIEALHPPLYVFVSAVKAGGHAEKAGLRVGDVLVECTDLFGQLTDATRLGVEKFKGLVKSRPDDEPLVFRVARGSRVLQDHEHALVELCRNPDGGLGATEEEMEQCVNAFVQSTYDDFDDASQPVTVECLVEGGDPSSTDCLLDSMYSMWAEEGVPTAPVPSNPSPTGDELSSRAKAKVKPWSSRSSPSGTYVRDPATGKLKNLDA